MGTIGKKYRVAKWVIGYWIVRRERRKAAARRMGLNGAGAAAKETKAGRKSNVK